METGDKEKAKRKLVVETNEYDVFLGRGKNSFYKSGNITFRKLSLEMARHHEETRGRETKVQLAKEVVAKIQTLGGRFLRPVAASDATGDVRGVFEIVSDEVALTKTKQAIRDAGTGRRRSKSEAQKQAKLPSSLPGSASLGSVGLGKGQQSVGVQLHPSGQNTSFHMPQLRPPAAETMQPPTPNMFAYNPNAFTSFGPTQHSAMPRTSHELSQRIAPSFPSHQQILAMLPIIAQSQREQQQQVWSQNHNVDMGNALSSASFNPYSFFSQPSQTQSPAVPHQSPPPYAAQHTPIFQPPLDRASDPSLCEELKPAANSAVTMISQRGHGRGSPLDSLHDSPLVQKQSRGWFAPAQQHQGALSLAPQDHADQMVVAESGLQRVQAGRSTSSPLSLALESNDVAASLPNDGSLDSDNGQDAASTHTSLSEQRFLDK